MHCILVSSNSQIPLVIMYFFVAHFRVFIAKEVKGPEVPVPRSELTRMVETAESARIKLYKNIEVVF